MNDKWQYEGRDRWLWRAASCWSKMIGVKKKLDVRMTMGKLIEYSTRLGELSATHLAIFIRNLSSFEYFFSCEMSHDSSASSSGSYSQWEPITTYQLLPVPSIYRSAPYLCELDWSTFVRRYEKEGSNCLATAYRVRRRLLKKRKSPSLKIKVDRLM